MMTVAAVAGYFAVIVVAIVMAWSSLSSIAEERETVSAAQAVLDQLEGRSLSGRKDEASLMNDAPPGSAFIEGQDQNVAGATLLQHIVAAVRNAGGNVISSQVDLEGPRAKEGWVGLVVSCDIEQPALQQLLYDIESGMPFLFVDQLTVQAPKAGAENGRMSVLLAVSGQWWRGK